MFIGRALLLNIGLGLDHDELDLEERI
jgi:hypothetical protein